MTLQQSMLLEGSRTGIRTRPGARFDASNLERQHTRCSCDLVKPSQRLQRLIHSTSVGASLSWSPKDAAGDNTPAAVTLEEAQDHLKELKLLVNLLPPHLRDILYSRTDLPQLVEVVLDLGRTPYARFPDGDLRLSDNAVSQADLDAAVDQVGEFGDDNRAGIDRTLHRISCMRNRDGAIVGLTCRVGRAVTGCACLAGDMAMAGKSILILGKPGVGKTTAIRELARLLAEESRRRVVIVDTSNEIGGDGDIPHNGVGPSRRMQVSHTEEQHRVMIEAVENHMPEVIVIDEIGTEAEALAARTIAQRGVQLIATAHGGHLDNIMKNPSLLDLLGGIESVTLGDEEARRRGGRKTVQERASPPTFDVAIELLERRKWCVYPDLASAVDRILLGQEPGAEVREQNSVGEVQCTPVRLADVWGEAEEPEPLSSEYARNELLPPTHPAHRLQGATHVLEEGSGRWQGVSGVGESIVQPLFVFSVGLDIDSVLEAVHALGKRGERLILTTKLEAADVVLAMRSQMRTGSWARNAAKAAGVPVYAVKNGNSSHLLRALETLLGLQPSAGSLFDSGSSSDDETVQYQNHVVSMSAAHNEADALVEVRQALDIALSTLKPIELLPRSKDILSKQAALVGLSQGFTTEIVGKGMRARLRILPGGALDAIDRSATDAVAL